MKYRPILFNAPMVRALLDGSKTQVRRVIKEQPANNWEFEHPPVLGHITSTHSKKSRFGALLRRGKCTNFGEMNLIPHPFGEPGNRLWVRESFSGPHCFETSGEYPAFPPSKWPQESDIWYWADGEPNCGDWTRPRPSIHMPRWASRITLEVSSVHIERLQDISEADALADGVTCKNVIVSAASYGGIHHEIMTDRYYFEGCDDEGFENGVDAYAKLWESINGTGSWDLNPWVWVIKFNRVEAA